MIRSRSKSLGTFRQAFCESLGLITDLAAGQTYSNPVILYWNVAMVLGLFLIIVFILAELKNGYEKTIKLNVDLQDTLIELKKTQDELERKAQELAYSNGELERFAYTATHDLKGLLITAGGYISITCGVFTKITPRPTGLSNTL
jgi:hypothetical protein